MIKPGALAIISPMAVGGLIACTFAKAFDLCLLNSVHFLLPFALGKWWKQLNLHNVRVHVVFTFKKILLDWEGELYFNLLYFVFI